MNKREFKGESSKKIIRAQILISRDEKALLKIAAKLTHLSITNFIRSISLQEAEKIAEKHGLVIGADYERV